jgi:4-amino-4-deoxy-L-arabinose transferase-like glycosyltransferase
VPAAISGFANNTLRRAVAWAPAVLLIANALVTTWVVFHLHPLETAIYSDMRNYLQRAWEIDNGYFALQHFFQPIGYSLWVAAAGRMAGGGFWVLKLSHVVLVWLSVFFGWRTARRLLPARWDLLALALMSLQVQWWALASFALSETLYTFFVTWLLWIAVRWAQAPSRLLAAAVGFVFAAGFYVKGPLAFFPPLLALWTLARSRHDTAAMRRGAAHLAIMAAVALSVALAHGAGAYAKYGQFKLGADAGGLNFVEGKCPSKHNFDSEGASWHSPLFVQLGELEEKRWSVSFSNQAYYWREGWNCVRENPAVLVTSVRYVYYLFAGNSLWPVESPVRHLAERLYEALFPFTIVPLAAVGMVAALRNWRTALAIPALFYLSLFLTVWLFKSELRFRIPFDAITMIYASYGAAIAWSVFARARERRVDRGVAGA